MPPHRGCSGAARPDMPKSARTLVVARDGDSACRARSEVSQRPHLKHPDDGGGPVSRGLLSAPERSHSFD
jgi:hypothetical protein